MGNVMFYKRATPSTARTCSITSFTVIQFNPKTLTNTGNLHAYILSESFLKEKNASILDEK